jgi:hypothetical protein
MSFYPENRFPKDGTPVYNTEGEQYDISDPRYAYHDGLENTDKVLESSVDNIFSTENGARARAKQLGCGGFHEIIVNGNTMYMPCETPEYYGLRMEQLESALNFTYIGSYRVLTWDKPFENVTKFNGWIIDTVYSNNNGSILDANDIAIDFRYSIDGKTWSLWTNVGTALNGLTNNFSDIFSIDLDPSNKFYPEFRFTSVLIGPDGGIIYNTNEPIDPSVVIVSFDLNLDFGPIPEKIQSRPSPVCSPETSNRPVVFSDCGFTFKPYAVNKALNIYQDLSLMVNKMFGLDANYYSVQPQARGRDVILREYTLFNVVSEKCVKLMVNQNQFPDNKINFDPFGLNYEDPFEVQMDKRYFESIFGKGSQPRKRDIIYFPITNRIYEINSTYLFRDFMNAPVYFKIELKKYNPKSNTYFRDPAHKEELDGISLTTSDLFGAEVQSEELKITNPQQYATTITQMSQDPIRSYVYKDLSIIGYDLNNNWTIVFNDYYDLYGSFVDDSDFIYATKQYREAIRYKLLPKISIGEELAFTAWFNIKNLYNNQQLMKRPYPVINISLESYDSDFLVFNSYPRKHNLERWDTYQTNPEGYVAIKGDATHSGGYQVDSIIDEYKFKVINKSENFSVGPVTWRMQKAQSRNLISGLYEDQNGDIKGFRADIIHSGVTDELTNIFLETGSLVVRFNDLIINTTLQFIPSIDEWYGVVINFSNVYKQISSIIWGITYDPTNSSPDQSSKLAKLHEDSRMFTDHIVFNAPSNIVTDKFSPYYGTDNNSYKIFTGPIHISNVRLFKNMIDIDNQSTVLNQNIVRDSQLAHIIDNAKPLLNIPKFARNK